MSRLRQDCGFAGWTLRALQGLEGLQGFEGLEPRENIAPAADKIMEEALKVISAYQQAVRSKNY